MDPYRCVAVDPPWEERGGGVIKRGADRHYALMSAPDIVKTILTAPVWIIDKNAHLWLWVTNNHLKDGLFVMKALGFRYVTMLTWAKATEEWGDGLPNDVLVYRPQNGGLGQYLRGLTEHVLFGVRGRLPALVRTQTTLVLAPRGRHSEKPAEAFEVFEAISPGPRLEMFARCSRPGWDVWGDEIEVPDGGTCE